VSPGVGAKALAPFFVERVDDLKKLTPVMAGFHRVSSEILPCGQSFCVKMVKDILERMD